MRKNTDQPILVGSYELCERIVVALLNAQHQLDVGVAKMRDLVGVATDHNLLEAGLRRSGEKQT